MAKSGASLECRRLLGYHAKPGDKSLLHHSRDALAGPLRELEAVLDDVRRGRFFPDRTRSGYRKPRASEGDEDAEVTESEDNSSEESTGSSDSSTDEEDEKEESEESLALVKHKTLDTLHLVNAAGNKTKCGSLLSEAYEDVELDREMAKALGCLQCFGHYKR